MQLLSYLIIFASFIGSIHSESFPPNLFTYNQGTFQAFYFFKDVRIDSVKVDDDDWVGTFNCIKWNVDSTACSKIGPCVGSRKWDISKCGSGVCDLPAMGTGGESSEVTQGYLDSGEYPVFLIYDNSHGVYYKTIPEGDVKKQKDICRNGYPYCYGWENFGFYFIQTLSGREIYMDCGGKLGGSAIIDECGACGGAGPQYLCEINRESYCTEYEFQQKCIEPETETE